MPLLIQVYATGGRHGVAGDAPVECRRDHHRLSMMRIALLLHVLAVVFWIGGMAFAHLVLRPALAEALEPPQRLVLLGSVLRRFLAGVLAAIVVLFASGGALLAMVPAGPRGAAVHAMIGLAVVMTAIYGWLRLRTYPRLVAAVAARDWPAGGAAAAAIRKLVAVNLVLGIVIIVVIFLGR